MSLATWWTDFWSPIAKPTANLAEEARLAYQAGKISFAEYERLVTVYAKTEADKAALIDAGRKVQDGSTTTQVISEAGKSILTGAGNTIKGVGSVVGETIGNVAAPVTGIVKDLGFLLVVGAILYLLILQQSGRRT